MEPITTPRQSAALNPAHADAIFARELTVYRAEFEGDGLISNGHVAIRVTLDNPHYARGRDLPRLVQLWTAAIACTERIELPLGDCFGEGIKLGRQAGELYLSEHYIRCFSPEATWCYAESGEHCKGTCLAMLQGELIGALMPLKGRPDGERRRPDSISDPEVFGPWGCSENGYYLIDEKTLCGRLETARMALREAQNDLEEAEAAEEDCIREVRSLEAMLRRFKSERGSR